MYQSKSNVEFDKADLFLYEEVTRMPPFKRRTLALIGPPGVGRRTLKGRLINSNPEKFSGVIPGNLMFFDQTCSKASKYFSEFSVKNLKSIIYS